MKIASIGSVEQPHRLVAQSEIAPAPTLFAAGLPAASRLAYLM
jgi:hypothetical protein